MRSRPWREVEFASLDFETTGLDRERDAVVSFGVVPVRGGRVVVREAVHQLVLSEVPASVESMRIHGILPKDLADAQPFPVAGQTLRLALAGRFLLAWFASVEIGFLGRLYGGAAEPLVGSGTLRSAGREPPRGARRRDGDGAALPRARRQAGGARSRHREEPPPADPRLTRVRRPARRNLNGQSNPWDDAAIPAIGGRRWATTTRSRRRSTT